MIFKQPYFQDSMQGCSAFENQCAHNYLETGELFFTCNFGPLLCNNIREKKGFLKVNTKKNIDEKNREIVVSVSQK